MFSWFLKLLGIEEDKPVSKNNTFMASAKKVESNTEAVKEEKAPEPAATTETIVSEKSAAATVASEPESEPKPKPESEPEPKTEPEPKPAAADKTLEQEFPGLKANFVKVLTEAGYTTKAAIDQADDKDLLALKGIGQATLKILRS